MNADVEARAQTFRDAFGRVRAEIGKVIVGHDDIVEGVLICLLASGHALLEGVPGLGKTLLVRTLSQVLDLSFSRVQFTPDLMPADISGTNILVEEENRRFFQFQPGPRVRQHRAGRRNQPRDTQDAVGHAGSDAGAQRYRGRQDAPPP
jgi:MoxR-like ATPase